MVNTVKCLFTKDNNIQISLIQVNKPLICNTKEEKSLSTACKTNLMLYEYLIHFKSFQLLGDKCFKNFTTFDSIETGLYLHSQKRHRLVASCQFYQLVATCQQVATSLSISSSSNKSVKIRPVATCHLQTCYSLLKKFATRRLLRR